MAVALGATTAARLLSTADLADVEALFCAVGDDAGVICPENDPEGLDEFAIWQASQSQAWQGNLTRRTIGKVLSRRMRPRRFGTKTLQPEVIVNGGSSSSGTGQKQSASSGRGCQQRPARRKTCAATRSRFLFLGTEEKRLCEKEEEAAKSESLVLNRLAAAEQTGAELTNVWHEQLSRQLDTLSDLRQFLTSPPRSAQGSIHSETSLDFIAQEMETSRKDYEIENKNNWLELETARRDLDAKACAELGAVEEAASLRAELEAVQLASNVMSTEATELAAALEARLDAQVLHATQLADEITALSHEVRVGRIFEEDACASMERAAASREARVRSQLALANEEHADEFACALSWCEQRFSKQSSLIGSLCLQLETLTEEFRIARADVDRASSEAAVAANEEIEAFGKALVGVETDAEQASSEVAVATKEEIEALMEELNDARRYAERASCEVAGAANGEVEVRVEKLNCAKADVERATSEIETAVRDEVQALTEELSVAKADNEFQVIKAEAAASKSADGKTPRGNEMRTARILKEEMSIATRGAATKSQAALLVEAHVDEFASALSSCELHASTQHLRIERLCGEVEALTDEFRGAKADAERASAEMTAVATEEIHALMDELHAAKVCAVSAADRAELAENKDADERENRGHELRMVQVLEEEISVSTREVVKYRQGARVIQEHADEFASALTSCEWHASTQHVRLRNLSEEVEALTDNFRGARVDTERASTEMAVATTEQLEALKRELSSIRLDTEFHEARAAAAVNKEELLSFELHETMVNAGLAGAREADVATCKLSALSVNLHAAKAEVEQSMADSVTGADDDALDCFLRCDVNQKEPMELAQQLRPATSDGGLVETEVATVSNKNIIEIAPFCHELRTTQSLAEACVQAKMAAATHEAKLYSKVALAVEEHADEFASTLKACEQHFFAEQSRIDRLCLEVGALTEEFRDARTSAERASAEVPNAAKGESEVLTDKMSDAGPNVELQLTAHDRSDRNTIDRLSCFDLGASDMKELIEKLQHARDEAQQVSAQIEVTANEAMKEMTGELSEARLDAKNALCEARAAENKMEVVMEELNSTRTDAGIAAAEAALAATESAEEIGALGYELRMARIFEEEIYAKLEMEAVARERNAHSQVALAVEEQGVALSSAAASCEQHVFTQRSRIGRACLEMEALTQELRCARADAEQASADVETSMNEEMETLKEELSIARADVEVRIVEAMASSSKQDLTRGTVDRVEHAMAGDPGRSLEDDFGESITGCISHAGAKNQQASVHKPSSAQEEVEAIAEELRSAKADAERALSEEAVAKHDLEVVTPNDASETFLEATVAANDVETVAKIEVETVEEKDALVRLLHDTEAKAADALAEVSIATTNIEALSGELCVTKARLERARVEVEELGQEKELWIEEMMVANAKTKGGGTQAVLEASPAAARMEDSQFSRTVVELAHAQEELQRVTMEAGCFSTEAAIASSRAIASIEESNVFAQELAATKDRLERTSAELLALVGEEDVAPHADVEGQQWLVVQLGQQLELERQRAARQEAFLRAEAVGMEMRLMFRVWHAVATRVTGDRSSFSGTLPGRGAHSSAPSDSICLLALVARTLTAAAMSELFGAWVDFTFEKRRCRERGGAYMLCTHGRSLCLVKSLLQRESAAECARCFAEWRLFIHSRQAQAPPSPTQRASAVALRWVPPSEALGPAAFATSEAAFAPGRPPRTYRAVLLP